MRTTSFSNHFFSIGFNYTAQGRIALAELNYPVAHLHLTNALRVLWDAGYKWRVSYPLVYIVQMFADQNELDRAIEILAFIYDHLYEQTRELANTLRHNIKAIMEPERFAAAWAHGQRRELSAVVNELLQELGEE